MKKLLIILFVFLTVLVNGQVMIPGVVASSNTVGGTSPTTLLNGLLACFNLDDADASITNQAGTGDGTAVSTSQSATAKLGSSQEFNNVGDYISISAASTTPENDKLTISAWIRMSSLPSTLTREVVVVQCVLTSDPWVCFTLYIDDTDKPNFLVNNTTGSSFSVIGSGALLVNTWYHIVGICKGNGQDLQIHINGGDVSTGADEFSGTGFYGSRNKVIIGNGGEPGTESMIGVIDEVFIYNRSVSVDSLYNAGAAVTYPFL